MIHRKLFERMSYACVNFAYPLGDRRYRVWAGVFFRPATILTVTHAFSSTGKAITRQAEIDPGLCYAWDADGTTYRIQKVEFLPTGDIALVHTDKNGPADLPLGNPRALEIGDLVYLWAYPITYEGYFRDRSPGGRYPYWGSWSVGWWEGPVAAGTGYDYALLCPSMEGQSGSPVVAFQDGLPKVVGVLSATFSVLQGGLLEQSMSYVSSVEHLKERGSPPGPEDRVKAWLKAYGPALVGGAVIGAILARG